ncbi:MAG: DMT family transporter [Parachlamydiales bacterium]|jgi:drug/metabolite transporter (DMT)-like permease
MQESPNIITGSLYAIVAFFCMAVFGILAKMGLESSPVVWVSFLAYLTGTLVLVPFIATYGLEYLKSEHYPFLIGRALFGTAASFLYTISIQYIPIVNGTLLFNTAPIFIPLLSIIFLKARLEKSLWLAVLIGFIGIIIIIKPTAAIFTQTGNLVGLASGMSLAIAYLLMKLLTNTDPGIRIIFYYLGIGTLVQAPLLYFAEGYPTLEGSIYAIISGLMLVIAQLALIKGYHYADASQIGVYQYSSIVFVGLIEWMFWDNVPPLSDLLGILLVAIAGMIIIRNGHKITHKAL